MVWHECTQSEFTAGASQWNCTCAGLFQSRTHLRNKQEETWLVFYAKVHQKHPQSSIAAASSSVGFTSGCIEWMDFFCLYWRWRLTATLNTIIVCCPGVCDCLFWYDLVLWENRDYDISLSVSHQCWVLVALTGWGNHYCFFSCVCRFYISNFIFTFLYIPKPIARIVTPYHP